jgi:hypothetical protein
MTTSSAAQALFASTFQPSDRPSGEELSAAVRDSLRQHGGVEGCAALCAAEYGDHPDTAPARMQWARALAEQISDRDSRAA